MSRLLAAAALCAAGLGHAATVVNVPGSNGGAGTVQAVSYPVAAGTVLNFVNPVTLALPAGDYWLTPTAVGINPAATFGGWNFQSTVGGSWGNHVVAGADLGGGQYRVLVDATTVPEPTCKNHFCAYDTEAQAIAAWLATPAFFMRLTAPTTVGFVSADYFLPDNLGGISLVVSAAPVPEPMPAILLAAGLLTLTLARRARPPAR